MATSYKIRLKRFNGTDYDTLNLISDNIIMSSGNNLQTDFNGLDSAIDDIVYVGASTPSDPDVKIWLDTDASGASAVNSINGKSGTVVLDADDVGAMSEWVLLWQNASPTSGFAAQTISLGLSEYSFVLIAFEHWNNNVTETIHIVQKNGNWNPCTARNESGTTPLRNAKATDNGVQFSSAYNVQYAQDNGAVPLRIYGIKGVTT